MIVISDKNCYQVSSEINIRNSKDIQTKGIKCKNNGLNCPCCIISGNTDLPNLFNLNFPENPKKFKQKKQYTFLIYDILEKEWRI